MSARGALQQYQAVNVHSGTSEASPHRLIQMLFEGVLDRLALAKGHMQRNHYDQKGHYLNTAISIIGGLQASLDIEKGGEVASNLDSLYEYMTQQLFKASQSNNTDYVDEVINLLKEIKQGWDAIQDSSAAVETP